MSSNFQFKPNTYGINPITGQHPNVNIASITRSMGSLNLSNKSKKKGVAFSNTYGGPLGSGVVIPHKSNFIKGGKRKTHKKSKKRVRQTRR